MAVRFNAVGDHLKRTTDLPDGEQFTVCGWAFRSVDKGAFSNIFQIKSAARYILFDSDAGGDAIEVFFSLSSGVGSFVIGTPTHPGWFFWALTTDRPVTNLEMRGYFADAADLSLTANSNTAQSGDFAGAIDEITLATNRFNEFYNGRLAAVRIWNNVALTQAQLLLEMQRSQPQHALANIYGIYPIENAAQAALDVSENGRDWTLAGVVETEDGPPIIPFSGAHVFVSQTAAVASSDGEVQEIVSIEVLQNGVVQIPADMRVIQQNVIFVNASIFTGIIVNSEVSVDCSINALQQNEIQVVASIQLVNLQVGQVFVGSTVEVIQRGQVVFISSLETALSGQESVGISIQVDQRIAGQVSAQASTLVKHSGAIEDLIIEDNRVVVTEHGAQTELPILWRD